MENQPCPMVMKDGEIDDLDKEVSESEDEDVKSREPSKNVIFNRESLADKLQDINWPENVGWIHKFVIDIDKTVTFVDSINTPVSYATAPLGPCFCLHEKSTAVGEQS